MKTKKLFLFLGLSIFFAACGDDNSSSAATEQDESITSSSALPESSSEQLSSSSSELLDLSVTGLTWAGYASEYKIYTGIAEAEWYMFNDSAEGGHSTITWPVPLGNDYTNDSFDPVIDECGGVCGTFNLNQGSMDHKPYVGVGFNLAGRAASEVDATAWGGICITYTSDVTVALLLGLSDEKEDAIGYDNPFVSLPKASAATEVCTAWEKFKQAGWGTGNVTGDEAAAALVAVKFKIQADDSTTGKFSITGISSIPCCAIP